MSARWARVRHCVQAYCICCINTTQNLGNEDSSGGGRAADVKIPDSIHRRRRGAQFDSRPLVRQSAVSALFCLPLLLSVPLYALAADQHALLLGQAGWLAALGCGTLWLYGRGQRRKARATLQDACLGLLEFDLAQQYVRGSVHTLQRLLGLPPTPAA
ncbi:Uncharacterised protein [Chromobacterium violaceum]|uniref:Uncharacterized protein n=1 Tax=Chromobacterium violaceum TaxID=536 RepID=A0A3S5DL70_CHRVL|nr:Uncharacterised protein [Chromobacterium violaceum]